MSANRTLTASGPAIPAGPEFVAVRLEGIESIDDLYSYDLVIKTEDQSSLAPGVAANLALNESIGKEVCIVVEAADPGGGKREISGICISARFLREEGRHAFYQLTVRPWLYLATLTSDHRAFQNQSVSEITDVILGKYDYPVEKRLTQVYPKRDYQNQYGETDLEYLQRIWQEWGISFFFEHSGGKHRLILTDSMAGYKPNPLDGYDSIRFHREGENIQEEYIDALAVTQNLVSGKFSTTQFDYTRPRANLGVSKSDPRDTAHNDFEIYQWRAQAGSSDYSQPRAGVFGANEPVTEGDKVALLRMQSLRSPGHRAKGGGNLRALCAGHTFTLTDHPSEAANAEYVTLWAKLRIEEVAQETQAGTGKKGNTASAGSTALREQQWQVRVDFEVHPVKGETYRPALTRQKPVVGGVESAIVVGPPGNDICTDEFGRIKVQFHWDRYGENDQNSSLWVRVAGDWSGSQLGGIFLPRIGQEVLIAYENGDPDLPVCVGRVFNQNNMPPWQLPSQQALSGFRSRELVQGGGNNASGKSNHLIFDDTAGKIQTTLKSDYLTSQLSLGYITRIEDNTGRKDGRGEGAELITDGHLVSRGASGMYLTTEPRINAEGPMKSMDETVQRLTQARSQHETLAEVAKTFEAQDGGDQADVAKALKTANDEIKGKGEADEKSGKFPELDTPHMVLSSSQGLHATSARTTHLAAGDHIALTSGENISLSVGKRLLASVTDGIRMFTRQAGMKLIAASDDIDGKALKGCINLFAKFTIKEESNRIELTAKEAIVLNGGGSTLTLDKSGIVGRTGGDWVEYAASHLLTGPDAGDAGLPGSADIGDGQLELLRRYANTQGHRSAPYKVVDCLGKTVSGTLNGIGQSFASGLAPGPAKAFFQKDPRSPGTNGSLAGVTLPWPLRTPEAVAGVGTFGAVLTRAADDLLPASVKNALENGEKLNGDILSTFPAASALPELPNLTGLPGIPPLLPQNLPGGLPGLDALPNLSGALSEAVSNLTNGAMGVLPESLTQTATQGMALTNAAMNIKAMASNPMSAGMGVVQGVAQKAASAALQGIAPKTAGTLPPLSTPPFV